MIKLMIISLNAETALVNGTEEIIQKVYSFLRQLQWISAS